ncbi:MAG: lysoplasmalogenase family protein [Fibrobacter sp.]|nr:lysoplasmalogenase family protein [Fibrobacter sp.]
MKEGITKKLVLFIAFLTLACLVKDWVDFARCGAVDQCLQDMGGFQNYAKFTISFLLTALAFVVSSSSANAQDRCWLRCAFISSLMADFCFRLIPMLSFELPVGNSILGIGFFMFFQSALTVRHSRVSDKDSHFPKAMIIPIVVLVVAAVLYAMGLVPQLVFVVGSYAAFLITSLCVACKATSNPYFSQAKAKLIKNGMIVFFIGDALVGLALATGEDHSLMETVAAIANNLIWIVYVPAQLMLIRSCKEN